MPEPLDDTVRTRMRRQGRRDTKLELEIRRRLHALGYRFRVDYRPEPSLRTRGDIVFTRKKVVVFIDGCYWHGCPLHATAPKNNAEWWRDKLAANAERDSRATADLNRLGWIVIRAWEHEGPDEVVRAVESVLRTESAGPPDQSFS
jgi:DNA mismatch endonuclease, patch repair protein